MRSGPRSRRSHRGRWHVHAHVDASPAVRAPAAARRTGAHGYELLDAIGAQFPGAQPDMGNLYRLLRSLEDEAFVRSEWDAETPGPARAGTGSRPRARLLGAWATALARVRDRIDDFLRRHEEGR